MRNKLLQLKDQYTFKQISKIILEKTGEYIAPSTIHDFYQNQNSFKARILLEKIFDDEI